MTKYEFLSDDWIHALFALVDEYRAEIPPDADLVMNVEVADSPWGDRQLHLGVRTGEPEMGLGFTHEADLTLALDYMTASEVFMAQDVQAGLTAFMVGRIRVQGDVSKLVSGGGITAVPMAAPDVAARLLAFTEMREPADPQD